MSVWEAAWVIARRDFVATVYSRSFILFLIVPLLLFGASLAVSIWVDDADASSSQPRIAVVADSATGAALMAARQRLADALTPVSERREGRQSRSYPILEIVQPAENVGPQAERLLADESGSYSAVLSGTLERLTLTGPARVDNSLAQRIGLIVEDARRVAALAAAGRTPAAAPVERVITAQAAGNLQSIRRGIARSVMGIIFFITILLATLLLSNLAEEKTNKVIEILAASVPLDSVFLGKLIAMLGISFVGLALWGGIAGLAYLFLQAVQDFVTLPTAGPAVGWPVLVLLVLVYYGTNYMLLGALFLGIGGQASNIREIQTLTMPVTMLQAGVFFLAISVVGRSEGALYWFAYIFPFSSPMAMIGMASESETLWPHLVALLWQALWIALIIRISSRLFRRTVLKSGSSTSFFNFGRRGAAS
ncbi:ABC transporter permease [Sphingosinicella sp.]|uniref:ABC transporter permease n=1 Tax=Sphingosinicella sp. TaxID=1917971 RepID=UPI0040383616